MGAPSVRLRLRQNEFNPLIEESRRANPMQTPTSKTAEIVVLDCESSRHPATISQKTR